MHQVVVAVTKPDRSERTVRFKPLLPGASLPKIGGVRYSNIPVKLYLPWGLVVGIRNLFRGVWWTATESILDPNGNGMNFVFQQGGRTVPKWCVGRTLPICFTYSNRCCTPGDANADGVEALAGEVEANAGGVEALAAMPLS